MTNFPLTNATFQHLDERLKQSQLKSARQRVELTNLNKAITRLKRKREGDRRRVYIRTLLELRRDIRRMQKNKARDGKIVTAILLWSYDELERMGYVHQTDNDQGKDKKD